MKRFSPIVFFALFCFLQSVQSHESPEHTIEALDRRMERSGPNSNLLTSRAFEYIELGNWQASRQDFQEALEINPNFELALVGLAKLEAMHGTPTDATEAIRSGLKHSRDKRLHGVFAALFAQVEERQGNWENALKRWREALATERPQIDWFIGESRCLAKLDRLDERVEALASAKRSNSSIVLHRIWIQALVDAQRYELAQIEIEEQLSKSRWKSTWFLLRAKIHFEQGNPDLGASSAKAALNELERRLSRRSPDPQLLEEASEAHRLLACQS